MVFWSWIRIVWSQWVCLHSASWEPRASLSWQLEWPVQLPLSHTHGAHSLRQSKNLMQYTRKFLQCYLFFTICPKMSISQFPAPTWCMIDYCILILCLNFYEALKFIKFLNRNHCKKFPTVYSVVLPMTHTHTPAVTINRNVEPMHEPNTQECTYCT